MTSKLQHGRARIRDILASLSVQWEEAEARCPSLYTICIDIDPVSKQLNQFLLCHAQKKERNPGCLSVDIYHWPLQLTITFIIN